MSSPSIVIATRWLKNIGHPIDVSGARILTTLLFEMRRYGSSKEPATLGIGGGMLVAMGREHL